MPRTTVSRWRRSGQFLAAAALIATLGACSGSDTATSAASASSGFEGRDAAGKGGASDGPAAPDYAGEKSSTTTVGGEQRLIRNGTISLQVKDIGEATAKVRAINTAADGIIVSENIGSYRSGTANPDRAVDPSTYAVLVISVPVDRLDATLDKLQAVGKVLDRRSDSENVTAQFVDTAARVESMRKSVARIQALIDSTKDMDQLIRLENELSTRQADLEGIEAQLTALERSTSRSPITVNLATEPDLIDITATPRSGFVAGLKAGWTAFVGSLVALFTVLGAVLPFAILALVLAWPARWLWRRTAWGRGPRVGAAAGGPAASAPHPAAAAGAGGTTPPEGTPPPEGAPALPPASSGAGT